MDNFEDRSINARRSNSSFTHLTLAPLSTRMPLDDDDYEEAIESRTPGSPSTAQTPGGSYRWHRTSYIQGKSAPTTPKILSRSSSKTRLNSKSRASYTHLGFAIGDEAVLAGISKSKSTTVLEQPAKFALMEKKAQMARQKSKTARTPGAGGSYGADRPRAFSSKDEGEWLFRAGTAISSEAREGKGQSWIVSRDSATSLIAQEDEDEELDAARDGYYKARSAVTSRSGSRGPSARTSRQGSVVGLKGDVPYFTPTVRRSIDSTRGNEGRDYFGPSAVDPTMAGPDFVDAEEDEEEEDGEDEEEEEDEEEAESEVAHLASEKGYGIGGFIDKLVGWTLFDVKEEGQHSDEDETEADEERGEQATQGTRQQEARLRSGSSTVSLPAAPEGSGTGKGDDAGWKDAEWLLSVAYKALTS